MRQESTRSMENYEIKNKYPNKPAANTFATCGTNNALGYNKHYTKEESVGGAIKLSAGVNNFYGSGTINAPFHGCTGTNNDGSLSDKNCKPNTSVNNRAFMQSSFSPINPFGDEINLYNTCITDNTLLDGVVKGDAILAFPTSKKRLYDVVVKETNDDITTTRTIRVDIDKLIFENNAALTAAQSNGTNPGSLSGVKVKVKLTGWEPEKCLGALSQYGGDISDKDGAMIKEGGAAGNDLFTQYVNNIGRSINRRDYEIQYNDSCHGVEGDNGYDSCMNPARDRGEESNVQRYRDEQTMSASGASVFNQNGLVSKGFNGFAGGQRARDMVATPFLDCGMGLQTLKQYDNAELVDTGDISYSSTQVDYGTTMGDGSRGGYAGDISADGNKLSGVVDYNHPLYDLT